MRRGKRQLTVGELHQVLGEMLAAGVSPDTPVSLRPKTNDFSPEPELPLGDAWHYPDDDVVFLDEVGV